MPECIRQCLKVYTSESGLSVSLRSSALTLSDASGLSTAPKNCVFMHPYNMAVTRDSHIVLAGALHSWE